MNWFVFIRRNPNVIQLRVRRVYTNLQVVFVVALACQLGLAGTICGARGISLTILPVVRRIRIRIAISAINARLHFTIGVTATRCLSWPRGCGSLLHFGSNLVSRGFHVSIAVLKILMAVVLGGPDQENGTHACEWCDTKQLYGPETQRTAKGVAQGRYPQSVRTERGTIHRVNVSVSASVSASAKQSGSG